MSNSSQTVWDDGERVFYRGRRPGDRGDQEVLLARPAAANPHPASLDRLSHEFGLKDQLDSAWAARPLELVSEGGQTLLVLDDPGGEPLSGLVGAPLEIGEFLRHAIGVAAALGGLHQRGLVHKDLKPAHILVSCTDGQPRLSGFGITSRLPRERQAPEPPETIAGTLAYMAPEQTGRMNRSIDARSDLYALGVTFYQMLTGTLPFSASDPMELVHCHIARMPVPPSERLTTVPAQLSRIVMKLLAKTAEERYQTAVGAEWDLQRCLANWERDRQVDEFVLGTHDTPSRLLIPEKLYGREREVNQLLAAFDLVVTHGAPQLVLVSGYSGIGKSAVVNELHKALVLPRALFASGKFDQYKRDIPYSTLVQAFKSLVRPLLGKRDTELATWRHALLEALEPNAQLMIDLIPELKLIMGDQPPVPELEPQQAQKRFQLVVRRFIGVFARPEHPLALFLDDLQWLDAATLDLLEHLLVGADLRHLMLVGAYRDNEVDAAHPLARKLQAIRNAGGNISEIVLAPLAGEYVGQLLSDALGSEPARVAPLARLVHEKTAGNPFFVIQFLNLLAEEGLIYFDHDAVNWSWNLDRIHAKGYTDNVVDLMVSRLARLPIETRLALQQFACLGNSAESTILGTVLAIPEEQVHSVLWEAVRQELVERQERAYKFIHDRVHEAAYSLIPEAMRAEVHLRIGRLLVARNTGEQREEAIFEIVNQLNRGAPLVTQQDERDDIAELNLIAGKRAKGSTAYASALTYLNIGVALLDGNSWGRRHETMFALELNRAECEFLSGSLSVADERLVALSEHAATTVEQALVACLHMDVCLILDQSSRAIIVGLDSLRHFGIEWSSHPKDEEVRREYERIWSILGGRAIDGLIDLPLMEDAASLATMDVLMKLWTPALYTDENLASLTICKAVSLSLERGNCDASCFAYVILIRIAGPHFGDYQAGFRFGQLGYDLVARRGLKRLEARTFVCYALFVVPWMKHVGACRDLQRRAFEAAILSGDLQYAAYTGNDLNSNLIFAGEPLSEAQSEAEHGLAFAEKARFGLGVDIIETQLALIRSLRGLTPTFGCLDDEHFDEVRIERRFSENPDLAIGACWYWIRKLQARCIAGDHAAAMDAAGKAKELLWTTASFFEEAEYYFYSALSHAACHGLASAHEQQQHLDALARHHRQLTVWAENCPENFAHRAALVGAEIARIEGHNFDAMRLYQQAIRSAHTNGFVHIEALANEFAARFHAAHDFDVIADAYLQNARYCYLRWRADGKVRQLEQMYPHLRKEAIVPGPTGTIAAPVEQLDIATVIKVSQAVSNGIVLEKLIEMVMRTAMEQAGAERGLLILPHGGEQRICAEGKTGGEAVIVHLDGAPASGTMLPESVLYYVLRTRESVILADAMADPSFAADPYIVQHRARSILCLPLMNQAKLTGALYLENNLTTRVFTPARTAVLRLVASQAAIALENAHLYHELVEREAKIRRLVDANIIGIFVWNVEGDVLEANDTFLGLVGYARDDLVAGRVRWSDLTPPDWRDSDDRALRELGETGRAQPFEKEYFKKDGSRVPVLLGVAMLEEGGTQGIAFVLDLSERKRAEAEVRRLAYFDPLTRLPNRTLLLERLEEAILLAKQRHRALALLHLEVGRFHEINKVLGYRCGDRLLQELGQRLTRAIKPEEILARVGDAEFALVLPNSGAEYAIRAAQRLMGDLHEPIAVADLMVDARVSIGIALFPGHGAEPDALLRRAGAATQQARSTLGGYAIYTGGQEQENTRRLALMGDLHHAIENNQLLLYCQPKVDIANRRVCGAEALVRWRHPVLGMISPVEFIKLAEHAGLITPLTNWVLEASFSQSYAWHEAGLDRPLSINLSAQDLRDPCLLDRIQGLFSTWGLSPELIQFELTESALMEDPVGGLESLTRLKRLGTALFIDDFGTGYSSLSYLQKLPVDALKIDQSFVMPMMSNHDSEVIVRSTIELGHNLELEVVAEGVESQPLWDHLAVLGCDVAQGYLMSMPMPADQFQDWNDKWSRMPVRH